GPSLPRRDRPEKYERYCRLMLIFFKPWNSVRDLHGNADSWSSAFDSFISMNPNYVPILNNMQTLHECRDSRDD
ncbi:hypothetical protein BDN70DRAFT_780935, partial [Pholiota conissans]